MWQRLMEKIVRMIDVRLEKYRVKPEVVKKKYTPATLEDFVEVIQRTPKTILSMKDRERIAAIMSFEDRKVADVMVKKDKMLFVRADEVLGPLVLDKLYKSGFTNFPVVNLREKVIGIIHTEALNALEIRKADKAETYVDKNVYYLHTNDGLTKAIEEIERTNAYYFLVLDENEKLAGFLTVEMIFSYLSL